MRRTIRALILSILSITYPIIYLYSQNARILNLESLWLSLIFVAPIGLLLFVLFSLIWKNSTAAGNATFAFIVFFYLYGIIFDNLLKLDWFQITHYSLLPLMVIIALYAVFFVTRLKQKLARWLHNTLLAMLLGLFIFNIVNIIPIEIRKAELNKSISNVVPQPELSAHLYPDIYFIIFDEYASFEAMKSYWKDNGVDQFQSFLDQNSFITIYHSHSATDDTLTEMASRLNMKKFAKGTDRLELYNAIANNQVMAKLKSYGYTTVVFDGAQLAFENKTPVQADYNLTFDPNVMKSQGASIDEFSQIVFDSSMLRVFSKFYRQNFTQISNHRNMTLYTLEKLPELQEIKSPKFVYAHLMLPHIPFIFDENGNFVDFKYHTNWNYYLGQHKFATKKAEELIARLLENADPNNPPIIILQSDHGARNHLLPGSDSVILINYPEEYKTSILNALYLPGYDYSKLADDLPPVEVFPIIFQHYFNENIEAVK